MNTIPSIFNDSIIPYTAVGSKERLSSTGISAVILSKGGHSRKAIFQEIENTGFDNVISIESAAPHYDIEELARRFPFVRFILPEKEINIGEQINLAASDIDSPLFFVLRSDMKIIAGGNARRMAERLIADGETQQSKDKKTGFKRLCTVPIIMNSNYEILPTLISPVTKRRKLRTSFFDPQQESQLSLYPFDGIGIYDRHRFIQIGGFDPAINKLYWQLMDFGFRSFLWGEEIALSLQLKICYDGEMPAEDYTVDENYRRFFLKNLAPVFRREYAHIPYYRFPAYFKNSGEDFLCAWEHFKAGRNWVTMNKHKWKCDGASVIKRFDQNAGESN